MDCIKIGDRLVGGRHPRFVIAEIAQAHDGSLGMAHAYIDAVAKAGCDAVKFQTHIAAAESTRREPWRVKFSPQDATRYEYWKRMEFTAEQWAGLSDHATDEGLVFLSSPFSLEAVELLERLGLVAWKIASGEVSNTVLLDAMAATGKPVLVSSGMSTLSELDEVVTSLNDKKVPFGVFQCTSQYPCPPENIGLNVLDELRERYRCPLGLSDHSGTIFPCLAAVVMGASMVEVHVTMSREMFGPDVSSSVTLEELKQLVRGVRFLERSIGSSFDKDSALTELLGMRSLFSKSIVAARPLEKGTVLSRDSFAFKKPGDGLPPRSLDLLLGRTVLRDMAADELILECNVTKEGDS